uniref:FP protein C-terminal domain-containing protein n=1 Tax=Cacopsylla melanoneura TaxID=428564 RepID=A0A8D9B0F7_9HEMI
MSSVKIKKLEDENRTLKWKMNEMEQYSRRSNVQINNIPPVANEDIGKILCEMGKKIGVNLDYNVDIQAAHRVPSQRENSKPIIVKFTNRTKRDEFLVAAKKSKLDCSQMDATKELLFSANSKIFVNEHLSPDNKKLFYEARKCVREKKIKSARTKNGKILVQRDDNSQPMVIRDMLDLTPFLVSFSQAART